MALRAAAALPAPGLLAAASPCPSSRGRAPRPASPDREGGPLPGRPGNTPPPTSAVAPNTRRRLQTLVPGRLAYLALGVPLPLRLPGQPLPELAHPGRRFASPRPDATAEAAAAAEPGNGGGAQGERPIPARIDPGGGARRPQASQRRKRLARDSARGRAGVSASRGVASPKPGGWRCPASQALWECSRRLSGTREAGRSGPVSSLLISRWAESLARCREGSASRRLLAGPRTPSLPRLLAGSEVTPRSHRLP